MNEAGGAWVLPVGLAIVGGMTLAAYARGGDEDPGTTTVVAICLCSHAK